MDINENRLLTFIKDSWVVILGSLFVFYGVLYAYWFYLVFDIPIFSYLSFTEIITYFLNDINLIVFPLIILIPVGLLLVLKGNIKEVNDKISNLKDNLDKLDQENQFTCK